MKIVSPPRTLSTAFDAAKIEEGVSAQQNHEVSQWKRTTFMEAWTHSSDGAHFGHLPWHW
jgi:hypothetical protein